MNDQSTRITPGALASLVGSRLCHDLVSPLGAIGNGVELLQMSGAFPGIAKSDEMQLISESIAAARSRIQSFRVAFGQAPGGQRVAHAEFERLVHGLSSTGRLKVQLDSAGDHPRTDVRMVLLGLMCMESAMPWGGRVLVCRAGTRWRLVAEAERTKPDTALWSWLGGAEMLPAATASEVHFPLLAEAAIEARRDLQWELDETGAEISF
ncbi:histidine phosphotransferase family protein [Paracoccus sp. TK19116]|uniref:Histidine phosphotransferase family protein n=1 Tax=Paracoccus albicereus TaxID=2922394 RepID=A0ABT1MN24_9RHOB|nr:histidine phosphotransferase family protein [Paracoccus albicereus]MCQ0969685.1 histidine phosphotransferase family protein [Paracoccus albicereus]